MSISKRAPLWAAAVCAIVAFGPVPVSAESLVYRPVNPNFGGNALNGTYLLGNASAQNDHKDNSSAAASAATSRATTASQFADRITSALISRVAVEIGNQILGENARDSGTFQLDGTSINFQRLGNQVQVVINDSSTGGSSTITIPAPVF